MLSIAYPNAGRPGLKRAICHRNIFRKLGFVSVGIFLLFCGIITGCLFIQVLVYSIQRFILVQQFSRRLFEEGLFATAIGFPTVPRDQARIRVMNSAGQSWDDLDHALDICKRVGRELAVI